LEGGKIEKDDESEWFFVVVIANGDDDGFECFAAEIEGIVVFA